MTSTLDALRQPLDLLERTLVALDAREIPATIIGSLGLLQHLPDPAIVSMRTQDVDVMTWARNDDELARIEAAMTTGLGASPVPDRPGKWILDGRDIDVLGRTAPTGLCGHVCFPEPFANVAYLDLERPRGALRRALPGLPTSTRVAGAMVACLGKCLKVARYLTLDDWIHNDTRRDRAARSLRDVMMLVHATPHAFSATAADTLLGEAHTINADVAATALRALETFVRLFDRHGRGFELAATDEITDPVRESTRSAAAGIAKLLSETSA